MCIAEPLDKLTKMAVKEFSPIRNRGLGRTSLILEDPRGPEHIGVGLLQRILNLNLT
jgi:hypothetical protein